MDERKEDGTGGPWTSNKYHCGCVVRVCDCGCDNPPEWYPCRMHGAAEEMRHALREVVEFLTASDDLIQDGGNSVYGQYVRMMNRARAALERTAPPPAMDAVAVKLAAAKILSELDRADLEYCVDPERGAYRGFAALRDRCDANMLLPLLKDADGEVRVDDEATEFYNAVMGELNRMIGC